MPDRNTLLLKFPNDRYPSWQSTAQGKTMLLKRTPSYVDDAYFYGTWNNRKDGFNDVVINIRNDGFAFIGGAVYGVKVCWSRVDSARIKVAPCDDKKEITSSEKQWIFSPTPAEEAVIVKLGNDKKRLWIKPESVSLK